MAKQIISNSKFTTTNEDGFNWKKEIQTSTNYFCDERISLKLISVFAFHLLWIRCSSSSFEYSGLYAATIDWQMIQRYPRHLSFYSTPSCLRVFPFLAVWTYTTVHSLECLVYFCKLASFLHCCLVVMSD